MTPKVKVKRLKKHDNKFTKDHKSSFVFPNGSSGCDFEKLR